MITPIVAPIDRRIVMKDRSLTTIEENDPLTRTIIGCCFKVHSQLGPGFNEKIYQNALKFSFNATGLKFKSEKSYKIIYAGREVGCLRLDLIVEEQVAVEVKAIENCVPAVFNYQIISYLKVARLKTGLLVNFGQKSCYIKRFKN